MSLFALPQATASWILGKPGLIAELFATFNTANIAEQLKGNEFVEGPFRASYAPAKNLFAFWNADYLSGTGDEAWGFVQGHNSEFTKEIFERCLYVVSQRLQGLTIDGAFFPKSYSSGAHSCLASRGSAGRQSSVGYFERHIGDDELKHPAIICVGPAHDFKAIDKLAKAAGDHLFELVHIANALLVPGQKGRVSSESCLQGLRNHLTPFTRPTRKNTLDQIDVTTSEEDIDEQDRHSAAGRTYAKWIEPDSPLSPIQRRILEEDGLLHHPIRIVGPGGSGKTLLMQLLTIRLLKNTDQLAIRILYIVHNENMVQMVRQRFEVLCSDETDSSQLLSGVSIKTLSGIARELLELEDAHVIDVDAHEAKQFQFTQVKQALEAELNANPPIGSVFAAASSTPELLKILSILVMAEISIAIKGHGLEKERHRYVGSAKNLSLFHGVLKEADRNFVFSVFERYHQEVFELLEVLDSDDLAISLLGRLRTPIWELRRKDRGYDYIFVDETQLFNENERRIIALLTNAKHTHVPVVLALDEAQAVYGHTAAGFAALGIENLTNESLGSVHRSTLAIVKLAYFVIQRSTDLFGPDFPRFSNITEQLEPDSHPLAAFPRIEGAHEKSQSVGKFVLKKIRELRRSNTRQICVIVHAEQYWDSVLEELQQSDLPLQLLLTRGERLPFNQPLVVLTRPSFVGGQEFDAVLLVGLEQGLVPPRMTESEALHAAVEQQAIREIYLSITRARYRVVVAISFGASISPLLRDALKSGLIEDARQ